MGRGKSEERILMRDVIKQVLTENRPMTVRQVFYQLVSREVIENTERKYKAVIDELSKMRLEGVIPFEWIEDRMRIPDIVSQWRGLEDFSETAIKAYQRDVWESQDTLIEVWVEKQALSGIFASITREYGVTLNVGRGYDGWSSIYESSKRYIEWDNAIVLYFGDFDPSGTDIDRSLRERLSHIGARPEIRRISLTLDQIEQYSLPPAPAKKTDSRTPSFMAKYGDMAVELDALPIKVLRDMIRQSIEESLDMEALRRCREVEQEERIKLERLLKA